MAVTIDGVAAFARWAGGDAAAAQAVRDAERQGDVAKRDLLSALREAFVTPIEPEDLFVTKAFVDEGPTLKRFRPRAQGRAFRIRKRTSHITIIVAPIDSDGRTR